MKMNNSLRYVPPMKYTSCTFIFLNLATLYVNSLVQELPVIPTQTTVFVEQSSVRTDGSLKW